MAEIYTDNLRLPKPGASQGTKTPDYNEALSFLDAALAGKLTRSVAGSSNVTLTSDEARNAVMEFTGVLTGNITVSLPSGTANARARVIVIWNNTSGAFTLTFAYQGGTGLVVMQGRARLVFHNGANVYGGAEFNPSTGGGTQTDFLTGLQTEWVSANSIRVKTGAASLPNGALIQAAADITKSGISLGASAWGHIYLLNNAGAADVEVVTTAPTLYFGTAYQKTGDATRRYLGSVRTNASGNVINFQHDPRSGFVRYLGDISAAPQSVLSAGTALVETSVTCAGIVPVTSRRALIRFDNNAPNAAAFAAIGVTGDSVTPPATGVAFVNAPSSPVYDVPLDSVQAFTYALAAAPSSGGLYAQLLGHYFER